MSTRHECYLGTKERRLRVKKRKMIGKSNLVESSGDVGAVDGL